MITLVEAGSLTSWIFFLGGGLLVLLIVFAFVVVYLYRKFKRRY
jgi:hypothetical protein